MCDCRGSECLGVPVISPSQGLTPCQEGVGALSPASAVEGTLAHSLHGNRPKANPPSGCASREPRALAHDLPLPPHMGLWRRCPGGGGGTWEALPALKGLSAKATMRHWHPHPVCQLLTWAHEVPVSLTRPARQMGAVEETEKLRDPQSPLSSLWPLHCSFRDGRAPAGL